MVNHIDSGNSRPKERNNMEMYLRVSGDEPGRECAAVTRMHTAFGSEAAEKKGWKPGGCDWSSCLVIGEADESSCGCVWETVQTPERRQPGSGYYYSYQEAAENPLLLSCSRSGISSTDLVLTCRPERRRLRGGLPCDCLGPDLPLVATSSGSARD